MASIEELGTAFERAVQHGRVAAGVVTAAQNRGRGPSDHDATTPAATAAIGKSRPVVVGPPSAPMTRWLIDSGRAGSDDGEAMLTLEVTGYPPPAAEAYLAAFAATLHGTGVHVRPVS